MKPSRWQYFVAADGPLWVLNALCAAVLATVAALSCAAHPAILADERYALPWAVGVVAALLLGPIVGTLFAASFLGPFYQRQAAFNGAPFQAGDLVRILKGPRRDQVAAVYELWPSRNQLRVDLGEAARKQAADVYSHLEVCRAPEAAPPNANDEGSSS